MRSIPAIRVVLFALAVLAASPVPAQATDRFVSVIEDLPLMQGLVENENAAVSFETAGGRLAEAEARGNITPAGVREFYQGVLPQLGWVMTADGDFQRDGERLKVDVRADGAAGAVVGFSLSPLTK
ncbi:MAG: hypothetical protein WD075_03785 [Rhodospirillales bacterium]